MQPVTAAASSMSVFVLPGVTPRTDADQLPRAGRHSKPDMNLFDGILRASAGRRIASFCTR